MISIVKNPPLINLSENPIVYGLQTNNLYVNTGVVSVNQITINTSHTHGQSFELSWEDQLLEFTCSSSPNTSGLEYPVKPAGMSLYDWVELLAGYLSKNYTLSNCFQISSSSNTITLTAKEKGSDYDLSISGAPSGTTLVITQPGVDVQVRENFKFVVQIFKESLSDELLGEDMLDVDDNLQAYFDIAEYIRAEVISDFTFPESSDCLIKHPESMVKLYVRRAEMYGNIPAVKALEVEDSVYAIVGGIDFTRLAVYNTAGTSWYDRFIYNKMFLTWQSKTKYISTDQTEKLYFLNKSESAITLNLVAKLYWSNGLSQSQVVDTLDCTYPGIVECNVGYSNLTDPDPDLLTKYEIWIEDAAGLVISEKRTFYIDHNSYPYKRYLIFENSLGGWDTVRFLGKTTREAVYQRQISSTINEYNFSLEDGQVVQGKALESLKQQMNTGWISASYKDYLRELMVSRQVYEIYGNMLLPVVVTNSDLFISKDDETLYNMKVELLHAFTDSHRSTSMLGSVRPVLQGSYNRAYNYSFDVNY